MGRLTRDPELRYTPKGAAVVNASIAISRHYTVDGEKREETTFVELTLWGRTGENYAKYLVKGDLTYVEGYLKMDQWEDNDTGKKRSKLTVTVLEFKFMPNNRDGRAAQPSASQAAPQAAPHHTGPSEPAGRQNSYASGPFGEDEEDDIPF